MGMFSPTEYFKSLYPDWFRETTLFEAISYLFIFFLLMSLYYLYLRYFERRSRLVINESEYEVGDEIDYRLHGNVLSYTLMIRKISDSEWIAYKLFRSGKELSLRRGCLIKIIDYMNRNFGFDDDVFGYDRSYDLSPV